MCIPSSCGKVEAKKLTQLGDRDERHLFGHTHRALALDVGVAAHWAAASARATDITAKQQQIDQHPDVGRAVSLLGKPHIIDADHPLSLNIDLGGLVQIFPPEAAFGDDRLPRRCPCESGERVVAVGMLLNEVPIQHRRLPCRLGVVVGLDHRLAQPQNCRDIREELLHRDVGGYAVNLAARVVDQAKPGEVLVSRTVVDLVAGSGLSFEDRGTYSLKGVPQEWQLYAVA